jgi:hypothetical protein
VTGSLARPVTAPPRVRGRRRRRLRRGPPGRGLRAGRPPCGTPVTLPLALLLARLRQPLPSALPRELAAPLLPACRTAHLLRVPRRRPRLVPLPALRAPFPRTHDTQRSPTALPVHALTRASETPPEAPSAPSTAPVLRRRAQRRARERAEPPAAAASFAYPPGPSRAGTAQRARRGRRARDLARSEHGGTLRVSMGLPLVAGRPVAAAGGSVAAAGGSVSRRPWISCPPPVVDQSPAAQQRRQPCGGGSRSRRGVGQ